MYIFKWPKYHRKTYFKTELGPLGPRRLVIENQTSCHISYEHSLHSVIHGYLRLSVYLSIAFFLSLPCKWSECIRDSQLKHLRLDLSMSTIEWTFHSVKVEKNDYTYNKIVNTPYHLLSRFIVSNKCKNDILFAISSFSNNWTKWISFWYDKVLKILG